MGEPTIPPTFYEVDLFALNTEPKSGLILPLLADHEIHIFLEVERSISGWNQLGTTLGALIADSSNSAGIDVDVWPPDIRNAMHTRYANQPVWESKTVSAGADLHSHLRNLVSGKSPDLSVLWTATALARRLLARADLYQEDTPREVRTARNLVWIPSNSARQRIGGGGGDSAPEGLAYAIEFAGLDFHAFRTGKAFVHAVLRIKRLLPGQKRTTESLLAAVELLEAVVALTRAGELAWYNAREGIEAMPTFRITAVLESLVKGKITEDKPLQRIFTYTYGRFAGPLAAADADNVALRLARHYTSDYAVKVDAGSVARVRDFDTVGHVITLEGAATVVAPDANTGNLPPFLQDFTTATLHQHYIPIALLALHEHVFLLDKTTESSFWPSLSDQTIERLKQLRYDSLSFRLAFRFSQVSVISMHNAVNRAFRQALNLDGMLHELSADVAEATTYLDAAQREKESRIRHIHEGRVFSLGRMGASALIGFAAFNIANAVLREVLEMPQPYAGLLAIIFMLILAVGAYVYQWRSQRHSSEHGERNTC